MTCNPHMHTGIKINPRLHTGTRKSPYAYGDSMELIPVCIWGFPRSPYAYRDISVTNRMRTRNISIWEIRSCIPICVILHTGIAVCYKNPPSLSSGRGCPYANGWGLLKSSHMGLPLCIMKLCAYGDSQYTLTSAFVEMAIFRNE
jgi:hypothetical protein